jgi:hypothetical protein
LNKYKKLPKSFEKFAKFCFPFGFQIITVIKQCSSPPPILDIDECAQKGGLNGNHCHSNTRCVNTFGSYVCECLPGYRSYDKFNCIEIDECATGQHSCHANANCINTQGSYHCQCKDDYVGNGIECKREYKNKLFIKLL